MRCLPPRVLAMRCPTLTEHLALPGAGRVHEHRACLWRYSRSAPLAAAWRCPCLTARVEPAPNSMAFPFVDSHVGYAASMSEPHVFRYRAPACCHQRLRFHANVLPDPLC